ncbi:MAG TPA: substrate-binding domain-containing protein [Variovorax sp.]|nr:substrate-binding domain-containing protein [Variovorax sp.]
MATRALLQELAAMHTQRTGVEVMFEAVGGVEAAKRVAAGEPFDVAVLASDAIDRLLAAGKLDGAGRVDLVRSGVGVAVPAGAARPDISTEEAVRHAVLDAPCVAYSTGPSGVALMAQFGRWGIAGELQGRLVQAPPGVPVASLLSGGEATLGFQQMSELIGAQGIELVGPLPDEIQIITTFSAAPRLAARHANAVREMLDFMVSTDCDRVKRSLGMERA